MPVTLVTAKQSWFQVSGFRFQVYSRQSNEMLIGCVREWRKEQGLLVMKGEEKEKDNRVSNSEG